ARIAARARQPRHEYRGSRESSRYRTHRRASLHEGSARSRLGDSHVGRAAALWILAVAERAFRALLLRGVLARLPSRRLSPRGALIRRPRATFRLLVLEFDPQ